LDETGWHQTIEAVSAQFTRLYEEQEDARRRVQQTGEELVRADVLLAAFQSPSDGGQVTANDLLVECSREPLGPFAERLAPILADEVRRGIVSKLNATELSVVQFHREFSGLNKAGISRRFKGLEEGSWVTKGRTLTGGSRRGATEQFYRATKPAIQGYDPLADPSPSPRRTPDWQAFEYLWESVRGAMLAGTFDLRDNRFLSWSMLRFDREGWLNALAGIESLPEFVAQEEERARKRIAESGETPIKLTLAFAGFEAPSDLIKAP
jgi:hypothetical protein